MQTTTAEPTRLELLDDEPQASSREIAAQDQTSLAVPESSPAGLMLAAMSRGASLEQVEKMMDLQERWEKREAEKAFREAFAAFRGENIIIPKTKHVDRKGGGSFDQAEYDEVCRRLSPALSRHGFSFRHDVRFGSKRWMVDGVENDEAWVYVNCHLEHKAGHAESLLLEGPPGDQSVNSPVQNMQVTASYLKRQSLLAITGTATGGEDDENKMRKREEDTAKTEVLDELRDAGRAASMLGMASLTKWWGSLTDKQRADLSHDFASMRKAARTADAEGQNG